MPIRDRIVTYFTPAQIDRAGYGRRLKVLSYEDFLLVQQVDTESEKDLATRSAGTHGMAVPQL